MSDPSAVARRGERLVPYVALCVFLSGAASLGLEVVWSRLLKLVFGSTTLAITTILVAYMLALGLGGLVGGKFASRLKSGVRAYGLMEVAIGLYAFAVPLLLGLFPELNRSVLGQLGFWPAAFVRFALVLAVLVLPTVMMGATLPILVVALARGRSELARRTGLLYGVNTLGAVLGVLIVTFVGFRTLGVHGTNTAAAVLDIVVGLLAVFVVAPRLSRERVPGGIAEAGELNAGADAAQSSAAATSPGTRRWTPALVSYGFVGFTALAYEVSWTRALAMVLGSSTYAFATMLAGFLAGIALGALALRSRIDRLRDPVAVYAGGLVLLGVLALGLCFGLQLLPTAFLAAFAELGISGETLVWLGLLASFLIMLGPTLVLGALFPLLVRIVGKDRSSGAAVGDVYFVNTIGSAAGAFAAGFVAIPLVGLQMTMAGAIAINFAAAAIVLVWHSRNAGRRGFGAALIIGAASVLVLIFPPAWNAEELALGVYYRSSSQLDFGLPDIPMAGPPREEMTFYKEGINCTVSVHRPAEGIEEGGISLRLNGKTDASLSDMSTQILSGHIPFAFGAHPGRVLVIGYASGITTGATCLYGPIRVDVCEIEPAVVEASHAFDPYNHRPLERSEVHLILDDGRTYLSSTEQTYDVIISEPSNPWISGCANLFTEEFFAEARWALEPGGVLLQWVQLYGMTDDGLRSVLAALHTSFDYAYGFLADSDSTDLILMASDEPLGASDLLEWNELPEGVRRDLARIRIFSTEELWSLLFLMPDDLREIADGASVVNTDDSMYVELDTPWHLYDDQLESPLTLTELLLPVSGGVLPLLLEDPLFLADDGPSSARRLSALASAYLTRRRNLWAADLAHDELARRGESLFRNIYVAERMVLVGGGTPDEAEALLDDVVRQLPDEFAPRAKRAGLLNGSRRPGEALRDLDLALRLEPTHLDARRQRMQTLAVLGGMEDADLECQALLDSPLVETEHRLWAQGAALAAELGHLEVAIERMQRYLELEPYSPEEWDMLAQLLEASDRPAEAAGARENVGLAEANIVLQLHWLARWHERFGSAEDALRLLEATLRLAPSNAAVQLDLDRLGGA